MTGKQVSERIVFWFWTALAVLILALAIFGCSATRIPSSLDNVQINSYLDSGQARQCSDYTVIIKMGNDSVVYYTYFVDKMQWFRLDKNDRLTPNKVY